MLVPKTRKWPPSNPSCSTSAIEASAALPPRKPPTWMPNRSPARPAPAVKPPTPQPIEDRAYDDEIPF